MVRLKGYVYAILNPKTRQVKIGCAVNLAEQMQALRQQTGVDFELLAFEPSKDAAAAEQAIHLALVGCPRSGEWYDLPPPQLAGLEGLIQGWAQGPPRQRQAWVRQPTLKKKLALHLCLALNLWDQPLAQVARTFDLTLEHLHALKSGAAHVQVEEIECLLNHLGYEISELRVERRSG